MTHAIAMTALITAKPGCAAQLKQAIEALISPTLAETGCVEFKVFQQADDAEQFVLWEIFADQAALQHHLQLEHTKAYFNCGFVAETKVIKHSEVVGLVSA